VIVLKFEKPDWDADGRDWPNRAASRFVEIDGWRWHVQVAGQGPVLLLVHGTGAATHSWRDLLPDLARHFTVVAPDLPGHGFSNPPSLLRLTLPEIANALRALIDRLRLEPVLSVGHSAGAAILARMVIDGQLPAAHGLVSLNGAFLPFGGMAGQVFPTIARLLFVNPFAPRLFAASARDRSRVLKLIVETGSTLDERGVSLYQRLLTTPGHVAGALGMMANWDLDPLVADLPRLDLPLLLVAGAADKAVPPSQATTVASRAPRARIEVLPGRGHLAHEERPHDVAALIERFAGEVGAAARQLVDSLP
jgi:magnesium chelatase accessory protein